MSFWSKFFKKKPKEDEMKFLIVGLGNPGPQYHYNRHNIGFMVLDALVAGQDKGAFQSGRFGDTCTLRSRGKQLLLLKPMTFMNLSGKAVRFYLQKEGIPQENVLVITDDIALPFGKIRIRPKGSAGGHNGLSNIEEVLGNDNYARMRFGVGSDFPKGGQVDYVLGDFPTEEMEALPPLLKKMGNAIHAFASQGLANTMNQYNG